jgi:DNA-binding NtrC family response regulator
MLLVDDHHETVEAFGKILLNDGHDVKTAESFAAAKTLALRERFDVLLCDIGLPDGEGNTLLEQVRAVYPIRSVAITGYAVPADVNGVAEGVFGEYLLKPLEVEQIRSAIENIAAEMELKRNRQQPTRPAA